MLDKLNADFEEILRLVKKCPSELQGNRRFLLRPFE
jgi:hypothetical protein